MPSLRGWLEKRAAVVLVLVPVLHHRRQQQVSLLQLLCSVLHAL